MGVDPSLSPELIEAHGFSSGFRGFDQAEVREFLGRVAAEVRALTERAARLESAWHSAEERAARPPLLDEDSLMAAVGDETATILRAARAAAADLRTRVAADTERIVAEAEERGAQIRAEAEGVLAREVKGAEEAAKRIVESARAEAAEMLDKARTEADAMRAAAQLEKTLTIEGAISTRERILEDLSRRRRVASVQIEQLRAGRERLFESYGVVRRTLEEVNDELNRADAEARAAADEVGRRMQRELPPEPPTEVAEDAVAAPAAEVAPDAEPDTEARPEESPSSEAAPAEAAETVEAAPPPEPPAPAAPVSSRGTAKRRGRGGAQVATATVNQLQEGPDLSAEGAVPHLRVVPDSEATPAVSAPAPAPGLGSKVDVLFARIRAGRADKAPAPAPASASAPTVTEPEPETADAVAESEVPRSDDDEALLQQREAAIADLESSLTRKLKRSLQDEQNDLLDRLRGMRGEPTAARLLPKLPDQIARYSAAAQPLVDKAAALGAAFGAEILHRKGRPKAGAPLVADLAKDGATTIVESLRRRLEHAISASAGDEQAVLVEALGGAYREWKSERIERIAADVLAGAFSRGTWHEAPEGTLLRWIVEDTDGPCPDCDDDALAGTLPKGEAFPTGQPYPPAHPGCRCLLVPVRG